jgi:hypothetical protein
MFKFNTLAKAQSFQNRAIKAMVIILGDDDLFWVVTLAEGSRLERGGYQVAA